MSRARHPALDTATVIVLAVLFVVVVAATIGTRNLVSNQEHKLLKQRTDELGLVINDLAPTVLAQLLPLTALTRGADPVTAFQAGARVPATTRDAVLLALTGPDSVTVVATKGPDLQTGQVLSGPVGAAATAAVKAPTFAVSSIFVAGGHHLAAVVTTVGVPKGYAVAQLSLVNPKAASSNSNSGPYSELNTALYWGTQPAVAQLVQSNVPGGHFGTSTASEVVHLGATPFLMVTGAKTSLVGSVELNAQWVVLGLGLLLTLLLGMTFQIVQRRRAFALDLVDERTAELNLSLVQLRDAQHQLVHRERLAAIGELASAVGHELRNPLAVISNTLYLLRRATGDSSDPRVTNHLATAEREVAAANLIVSDLLEYSRAREPIIGDVDLAELVTETLSVAPHPEGVDVDWSPPTTPVPGRVDRDQMRQVLLNLVTNAYDAMPEGGRLRLGLSRNGVGSAVEVADSGTGIDEPTVARIFEPFFTTKARGVGLGLAVTHRIVVSHGGTITVDSTPNVGTTFTVTIPDDPSGLANSNGSEP